MAARAERDCKDAAGWGLGPIYPAGGAAAGGPAQKGIGVMLCRSTLYGSEKLSDGSILPLFLSLHFCLAQG
jgi:hypothetical protein